MSKLADFIVKYRNKIGIFFLLITIISILLIPKTNINYDFSKYIPDYAPSKDALNAVEEEFGMQSIARVMINNITLAEGKQYKEKIEDIDGVYSVIWIDDSYDVNQPESFIPEDELIKYYKDRSAIFDVMFDEGDYSKKTNNAITEIQKVIPEDSNMIGAALDTKSSQDNIQSEIIVIMAMLIPLTIIILLLTTTSWVSPILFITVIATSILLNMGSNIFLDSVSFLTFSISAALQFAVSMDYSVFMLHQFEFEKKNNPDTKEAMKAALKNAIVAIMSSSLTTIAGFLALAFMDFGIGADIGIVFAKGIVFSLLCVIFLMPYLILKFNNLIEKTSHKSLLPSFEKMGIAMSKVKWLAILIGIIIIIPSFVAQNENKFLYGVGAFGSGEGTKLYKDEQAIVNKFGRSNPMLLLVPNESYVFEKEMIKELENIDTISKVQSLANTVPEGVPYSFINQELYSKFQNENYTRILIYSKTASESELATQTLKEVENVAKNYYGDKYKLTGTIPVTYDMKSVVESDYSRVNLISILAILLILIFTFKNITVSILLVVVIESGIFINMAIPYFSGDSLIFMGYLIVSSIELGATIDYAILATNNYFEARKTLEKNEAMIETINKTTPAVLTSGGILIGAGYLIKFFSSMTAVSEMGGLIGRGALISVILVIFLLPQLLVMFDKMIHMSLIPRRVKVLLKKRRLDRLQRFKKSKAYQKQLEIIQREKERLEKKEELKKEKAQKRIDKKIEKLINKKVKL